MRLLRLYIKGNFVVPDNLIARDFPLQQDNHNSHIPKHEELHHFRGDLRCYCQRHSGLAAVRRPRLDGQWFLRVWQLLCQAERL